MSTTESVNEAWPWFQEIIKDLDLPCSEGSLTLYVSRIPFNQIPRDWRSDNRIRPRQRTLHHQLKRLKASQ